MVARQNDHEHQMLNSPFKWVGGKSRLRKQIISFFPQHTCYVELFAGAAWVLFGKQPSKVEVLNDIDQDIITFFRVVKEKPEELLASFEWELVSRAEFERQANLNPLQLTDVQRAHRFYYLIMASWGGEFHYPRFQTSINDGGHGNRLFGALQTLRKRVLPVYERLQTVIIENLDWEACFDRYNRPGALLHLDPPYPENGCNYVYNMREKNEHIYLAEKLHQATCTWILSSYDTPFIRELFSTYTIVSVQSKSGMDTEKQGNSRVTNKEVLIMNFEPLNGVASIASQQLQQSTLLTTLMETE